MKERPITALSSGRWLLPAVALVALLVPVASRAAESPPSAATRMNWDDQTDRRALNGHFFLPSQVVGDPFTATYFGSSTAFGYGRFDVPVQQEEGGTASNVRLKLAALQQRLDLQVGLGEAGPASFALRAQAAGNAIVGVNQNSALYFPLNLGYEFGVGFLVKPWGNRYFQVSVSLDYLRNTTYSVSPLTALRNTIQQGSFTADGLLSKSNSNELKPGIQLAVSPYKVIGLMSSLYYDWSRVEGGSSDYVLDWGLALSIDLGTVVSFPLGLQGVYDLQKSTTGSKDLQHYGGGGLWYTGRKNLALGVEAVVTKSDSSGVHQMLIQGQFRLRYYW